MAEKSSGGKAILRIQLSHSALPVLNHAELSFNMLSSLSLDRAQAIADSLNEHVLDLSITLWNDHPLFKREG